MSHPVLTSGYAHSKDGCFPIDQLDFAMWSVPKKRGKRDPPGHPVARSFPLEGCFYLYLLSPFPPLPQSGKKIFPTVPVPLLPYNFSPFLFAPRKFKAENDNPLPVARISCSEPRESSCRHLCFRPFPPHSTVLFFSHRCIKYAVSRIFKLRPTLCSRCFSTETNFYWKKRENAILPNI